MRPQPIVLFERLYLASLLFAVVSVALYWPVLSASAPPAILVPIAAVMLAILAALALLVSRRRSQAAKWVIVILTLAGVVLSVPSLPQSIAAGPRGWVGLLQTALQLVAVLFLFTAPARVWLAGDGDAV